MTIELDIEAFREYNNLRRQQAAQWDGGRGAYPAWDAIEHIDLLLAEIERLKMTRIAYELEDRVRLLTQIKLTSLERDLALEKLTRLQEAFLSLQSDAVLEPARKGLPIC